MVPGAVCQIRYTVYRLSSGAYFKESSGGKPVYMFSTGYGKEGKVRFNRSHPHPHPARMPAAKTSEYGWALVMYTVSRRASGRGAASRWVNGLTYPKWRSRARTMHARVLIWRRLGGENHSQDDLDAVYSFTLGEPNSLPASVSPAVVGMRAGGIRRVLVPARYGWGAVPELNPKPDNYGTSRWMSL